MTEIKAEVDFIQLARDISIIKQAVMGNGVKGLCERVNDIENAHNKIYRLTGIFGGIGVVLGSIVTYIVQIFRG